MSRSLTLTKQYWFTSIARLSLNTRLLAAMIIMFLLGFSMLAFYLLDSSKQLRRIVAHTEAKVLTQHYQRGGDINQLPRYYEGEELSYTLYNPQGQALKFSDNLTKPRKLRTHVVSKAHWLPKISRVGKVINVPVYLSDGFILMVARNDQSGRDFIDFLMTERLLSSISVLLPIFLLCFLVLHGLLKWALKPVKQATKMAEKISPEQLIHLPSDQLPKELLPFFEAANHAFSRLAQAYQVQQRFVADAAHELRTPLAVLSLHIENFPKNKQSQGVQAELKRLKLLVSNLLQLAQLEAENTLISQRIAGADIAREIRHGIAQQVGLFTLSERSLRFSCVPATASVAILLCKRQFQMALKNLLENAFYHGEGQVELCLSIENNQLLVQVMDQGKPPERAKQAQLLERFSKIDANSQGSGLGLNIVKQIMENHQGELFFKDNKSINATTCVVLSFPLAP